MDSLYKVCIRSYTFNHAQYIEDAMNGFVMQETDFPFVAAIVDDASTDNAQQVISNYFEKNFDTEESSIAFQEETEYGRVLFARHNTNKNCFFAVVLLKQNHYQQKKSKLPYVSQWMERAEYIALCEGDDYWIDSKKLQIQADYMDRHPDCSMCTHTAYWETNGEQRIKGCSYSDECSLSTDEVIRRGGYYLATASLLYRINLVKDCPNWRVMANVGDFPLQILGSLRGELHFFPRTMCVYRYMVKDSFSSRHSDWEKFFLMRKIDWMKALDKETEGAYSKPIYFNLYHSCYKPLFRNKQTSLFTCLMAILKSDRKVYNLRSLIREMKKGNQAH